MTDIAIATAEALRELTGYVRPDAQRRWLDANGVRQAPPPREVGPDTDAPKGALQGRRRGKAA